MKLLGRKKDTQDVDSAATEEDVQTSEERIRTTAPKGKPTPKRSEASRKRGPVAPAPMTTAEARRRRKEIGGPKLSRDERKAERRGHEQPEHVPARVHGVTHEAAHRALVARQ